MTELLLNGIWEIEPGGPEPPPSFHHRVQVPALVDIAEPGYDWQQSNYHWYRTTCEAPELGKCEAAFLVLEQAMFGTEVWFNGARLGGNIACYTSQEYNVSGRLRTGAPNELLVRVGARSTLPPESAVGNDQERTTFIPGIWGDVRLCGSGSLRIKHVLVIPHIQEMKAEVRVTMENLGSRPVRARLTAEVFEKRSSLSASDPRATGRNIPAGSEVDTRFSLAIPNMRLWSPEHPFLYEVEVRLGSGAEASDRRRFTFGMREFKVEGGDFLLNGKRIRLRGGNIAFHRFLSSSDRKLLPWDLHWVKKLLIDIPKAHNFNFFRNHLGQMYNRWYDLADEHGILLQNEWQFWTTSGTRHQITTEFSQWVRDNGNHPSIIIWDALNESTDDIVQKKVVPAMKKLDPSRPWESLDFVEEHPYIYSLGPVLSDRRFGFARSLRDLAHLTTPSVLNEFLWWWLDRDAAPTPLTQEVVERWLGRTYTREDLLRHQAFLAGELVELFRRMGIDAIQPFVYLSANEGPTSHWFLGDIKELRPKPVLAALRNAFSPFGLSLELWDRHFEAGQRIRARVYVFNDTATSRQGQLAWGVKDARGAWLSKRSKVVKVRASAKRIVTCDFKFPPVPGSYTLAAELLQDGTGDSAVAYSHKPAHLFVPVMRRDLLRSHRVGLLGGRTGESGKFLSRCGARIVDLHRRPVAGCDIVVIEGDAVRSRPYRRLIQPLTAYVESGGTLVLLEPEYGVRKTAVVPVLDGFELKVERRTDADRGGYDSHVFAEDHAHAAWHGIGPEHLKFFNGAYGGEMVSQYDVTLAAEHTILARCGLRLKTIAAAEVLRGAGRVIVMRLQLRGRLMPGKGSRALFGRRPDPVARQLFLNLVFKK